MIAPTLLHLAVVGVVVVAAGRRLNCGTRLFSTVIVQPPHPDKRDPPPPTATPFSDCGSSDRDATATRVDLYLLPAAAAAARVYLFLLLDLPSPPLPPLALRESTSSDCSSRSNYTPHSSKALSITSRCSSSSRFTEAESLLCWIGWNNARRRSRRSNRTEIALVKTRSVCRKH